MVLGCLTALSSLGARLDLPLSVRIGLHSGNVVAGVIGRQKFIYDLLRSIAESVPVVGSRHHAINLRDMPKWAGFQLLVRTIRYRGMFCLTISIAVLA